ncbi:aminopeptidase [bacterium]|nr:aminopeptidase [bacterium]
MKIWLWFKRFILFVLFFILCAGILYDAIRYDGYIFASVRGYAAILYGKRPISEILRDERVPEFLRERLLIIERIRTFASSEMGLPQNGSYTEFSDVGDELVWVVIATPRFSLEPVISCYPIVGCMAQRGYFRKRDAWAYADRLSGAGYDVTIRKPAAFSTLRWFNDPVFSTMLGGDDISLAGHICHELAHQKLYIQNDPMFNEAFASVVEETCQVRYIRANVLDSGAETELIERKRREHDFFELIRQTKKGLKSLYDQKGLSDTERTAFKDDAFADLRVGYEVLKKEWGNGADDYDGFMSQKLNNAHLAGLAEYYEFRPAFRVLLVRAGGNMDTFYEFVDVIGRMSYPNRAKIIESLSSEWTPKMEARWIRVLGIKF